MILLKKNACSPSFSDLLSSLLPLLGSFRPGMIAVGVMTADAMITRAIARADELITGRLGWTLPPSQGLHFQARFHLFFEMLASDDGASGAHA